MRKKLLSILLAVALIVTVFPPFMAQQVEAAGTYFIFPDMSGDRNSPIRTNDKEINLDGSYNSVSESSIVYSVEQILNKTTMQVGLSRLNTTAGLAAIDGSISVMGLDLFPGLNRITFKGNSGFSALSDTFFVEYIDNPVLYNLKFIGSSGDYGISQSRVIVTEGMTTQPGTGNITLQGLAPNSEEVRVFIGEDFSKSFPVVNDQFFASGLTLERGKNTVKFVVSNDDQNVETTKEFIYFNGDITFFDMGVGVDLNGNDDLDVAENYDLESNPEINGAATSPDTEMDDIVINGKLVVPNYYILKPDPPVIKSAIFNDNGTAGWGDGDQLVITFDKDTNEYTPTGGFVNDGAVDTLINWSAGTSPLIFGSNYHAEWQDPRTLMIEVDSVDVATNITPAVIADNDYRIGILDTAGLRTADGLSDPSDSDAQLTGTLDDTTDIPYIMSVLAEDGSNSPGYAANDRIVIEFSDAATIDGFPIGTPIDDTDLDTYFTFSHDLGDNYYGQWMGDETLRITITDTNGTAYDPTVPLTVTMAMGAVENAANDPALYDSRPYEVRGSFGVSATSMYEAHPDVTVPLTAADNITVEILGSGEGEYVIDAATYMSASDDFYASTPPNNAEYYVLEFKDVPLGDIVAGTTENLGASPAQYIFEQFYALEFSARNYVKTAANGQVTEDSQGGFSFTLKNDDQDFVENVRFLTNFDTIVNSPSAVYSQLSGVTLNGDEYEVFEAPFELEIQANGNISALDAADFTVVALDENGVVIPGTLDYDIFDATDDPDPDLTVPADKRIIQIKQLPRVGYQVLRISINGGPPYDQPISYIFGAYANFDTLYNGMRVEAPNDTSTPEVGVEQLRFTGRMYNVDPSTIVDPIEATSANPQTLFMTINGNNLNFSVHNTTGVFSMTEGTGSQTEAAIDLLNPGRNTLVLTYRSNTEFYSRTIIINVFPTDYPEVPAEGSSGIYPTTYADGRKDPDRFIELSTGMYTSKEKEYSVFGSFRLVEFDNNISTDLTGIPEEKYRIEILRNGVPIVEWDVKENHFEADNGTGYNTAPSQRINNFNVVYNRSTDYFTFELEDETVPDNTGTIVYTFVAYKDTANTFYRMEIQTVDTPYTILRPFLPEQKVINQNYIDLIVHSENAVSMTSGKFTAEKIDFDEDNDGDVDFTNTFKVRIKDLKANKDTDIDFTLLLDTGEEVEGSITVLYTPTNIEGAQHIETMGNKMSAFNKSLELSFPRNTVLMNKVDPTDRNALQKLYANHDILFGIGNRFNGIVDRRVYEDQPSGFANKIALSELEFNATLPDRFTMASPLYWIDAGLADDPSTSTFDPVEGGLLPFQFPATGLPSYMDRQEDEVLIPTLRGELTLQFDQNVVQTAGTQITVFRYDPILQMWENIGGEVDDRNNTVTVPFDQFGYYSVMKLQYSYVDITSHPYARDEMEAIYAKGVMNSFDDEDFGANNNITRGEFAAMIIKALQIPLNYDNRNLHFDDVSTVIVPGALWDYRYVETAAREGIIHGISPRIFEPYSELTREQAAVVLARALELKMEVNKADIDEDLAGEFQDYSSIYIYARPAVLAVLDEELMKGSQVDPQDEEAGFVFEPKDNLLRSDASIMMTRVMASLDLLPEMN